MLLTARHLISCLALAMGVAALGCSKTNDSPAGHTAATEDSERISSDEARALVSEGATMLDVRTPEEFAEKHVAGATNVPVDEIESRTSEIPKDKPVITYCRAGGRAHRAAVALRQAGYTVHELGGQSDWDGETASGAE